MGRLGPRCASAPLTAVLMAALVAGLVAGLMAGCATGRADQGEPRTDGPLQAVTGPPVAVAPTADDGSAPDRAELDGAELDGAVTFGAVTLCTTEPGADLRLTSVTAETATNPASVQPWLRLVPAAAARGADPAYSWAPLTGVAGRPPDRLAAGPWRGELTPDLAAAYVAQRCTEVADLDQPRTELLLAVTAGASGARLTGVRITYRVDDDDYVLLVPVRMTVCGTTTGC